MRHHRTLDLDPGRRVTVHELRVSDVRQLLPLLSDPTVLARPLPELLHAHLPDLMGVIGDNLTLPPGVVLDELTLSECEAIGAAWWELHRDFFLCALAVLGNSASGASTPPPSPAPASVSNNAVSPPPGSGAGAIS